MPVGLQTSWKLELPGVRSNGAGVALNRFDDPPTHVWIIQVIKEADKWRFMASLLVTSIVRCMSPQNIINNDTINTWVWCAFHCWAAIIIYDLDRDSFMIY
jgi:hypothetical protein